MRKDECTADFQAAVSHAARALKSREFALSRSIIASAMAMNMDAPEPHNLLGILYELMGDDLSARQHYRAAYALDPTYKPCCRNLERLTLYGWSSSFSPADFGIAEDKQKQEEC